MKKIISAFLTAVLLFGMITVPALAGQEKIEKNTIAQQLIVDFLGWNQVQEELICTVSQDLELLKVVGLDALVKIDKVDNDGSVTYKIQFEDSGVVDYLKVEKDAEENIVLRVRENELQNELIYTSNKKIYLDGYEVENQENISLAAIGAGGNADIMAGAKTTVLAINLPNGRSSVSTNVYERATSLDGVGPVLSLGQQIGQLAVSVLISLISAKLTGQAVLTIGGVGSAILSSVLQDALNMVPQRVQQVRNENPTSSSMSYKLYGFRMIGNNSLYSEFIYAYNLYLNATCDGTPIYIGVKKIIEAT